MIHAYKGVVPKLHPTAFVEASAQVIGDVELAEGGGITGFGAFKLDDANQPSLVVSVVRFTNIFRTAGETQIIMTIPQD
ncbi:MAG: hypothetical protein Q8Q58_10940 [Candidatus Rokubacteria bacterium]|nr:hypothetical protein [Candidatus Rokubacteria bacterium]